MYARNLVTAARIPLHVDSVVYNIQFLGFNFISVGYINTANQLYCIPILSIIVAYLQLFKIIKVTSS